MNSKDQFEKAMSIPEVNPTGMVERKTSRQAKDVRLRRVQQAVAVLTTKLTINFNDIWQRPTSKG